MAEFPDPLPPPIDVPLTVLPPHPCPYLLNLTAHERAFATRNLSPNLYHQFMDAGFRRSGYVIYQPVCHSCRACVPIRVEVERFTPSKSQRRCMRRNMDLNVSWGPPTPTAEKWELYQRYQLHQHAKPAEGGWDDFIESFYQSPVHTLETTYRTPAGTLIGVSFCDLCSESLSSVYFFWDPADHRRSLGVYSVLQELSFAQTAGVRYYYLGYWVNRCQSMQYKTSYRPFQLLGADGIWRDNEISPGIDLKFT